MASHTDSSLAVRCCGSPRDKEKDLWAGDPEAISSVRRPRRTAAQLRLGYALSRSQSLKEGGGCKKQNAASSSSLAPPPPAAGARKSSISRSHSLREATQSNVSSSSHSWRRAHSLKENTSLKEAAVANTSSVTLELSALELGGGRDSKLSSKSRQKRFKKKRPRRHTTTCALGSSPETKSAVWGNVASEDEEDDGDLKSSNLSVLGPTRTEDARRQLPPIESARTGSNTCWEANAIVVVHADDTAGSALT